MNIVLVGSSVSVSESNKSVEIIKLDIYKVRTTQMRTQTK